MRLFERADMNNYIGFLYWDPPPLESDVKLSFKPLNKNLTSKLKTSNTIKLKIHDQPIKPTHILDIFS